VSKYFTVLKWWYFSSIQLENQADGWLMNHYSTFPARLFLVMLLMGMPCPAQTLKTHLKSPASGMHFTQGIPLRLVADGIDPNGWQWLDEQMEAAEVRFYVDGVQVASDDHARGYNHFEAVVSGLSVGAHKLTTRSSNFGDLIGYSDTAAILIDPPPGKANAITLTSDIVLTGTTSLNWQDAIVRGNGRRVTCAADWKGSVVINNSFITGLGVTSDSVPTAANSPTGIDLATTGAVEILNSVFEWTGGIRLAANGSSSITINGNEFRANMHLAFVSSDPGRSPFLEIHGNSTGRKLFQANNVGTGFLYIVGMSGWLIGGSADSQTNVFIGPRMGTSLESSRGDTIRGNYMHHDYSGGWSQGFCCQFQSSSDMLVEHTVIRDGSWPVQSMGGEFRYNFVEGCGHEWVRTLMSNTRFHHNILHEPGAGGDPAAGLWMYGDQTGVSIYNNTFDGKIDFPAVSISSGSSAASLRNNIFCNFKTPAARAVINRYLAPYSVETDSSPRIAYADYNCFYNPASGGPDNYAANIVTGRTEGNPGWAGHDLGGVDGRVDPRFSGGASFAFDIDEAGVWSRTIPLSKVLATLRSHYTPEAGSPVVNAGDPADGAGVDIGAVGAGADNQADLFGIFGGGASVNGKRATAMRRGPSARRAAPAQVFSLLGRRISVYSQGYPEYGQPGPWTHGLPSGIMMVKDGNGMAVKLVNCPQ
jgi:hypothetical protein